MGFEKFKRPLDVASLKLRDINLVTGASSAGVAVSHTRGVVGLVSTSTTNAAIMVFNLAAPQRGHELSVVVDTIGATSAIQRLNAGSGVVFAGSSFDMITFSSAGGSANLVGKSTSRWLLTGLTGGVLSTST